MISKTKTFTTIDEMHQSRSPSVQYHFREHLTIPNTTNKNNDHTRNSRRLSNLFNTEIVNISQNLRAKFESELPFLGYLGNRAECDNAISLEMGIIGETSYPKRYENCSNSFSKPLNTTNLQIIQNQTNTNETSVCMRKQTKEMVLNSINSKHMEYPNLESKIDASPPNPSSFALDDTKEELPSNSSQECLDGDDAKSHNGFNTPSKENSSFALDDAKKELSSYLSQECHDGDNAKRSNGFNMTSKENSSFALDDTKEELSSNSSQEYHDENNANSHNGFNASSIKKHKGKRAGNLQRFYNTHRSNTPQTILTPRTSTGLIPTSYKSSLDKTSLSWIPLPPRPPPEIFPYKGHLRTTKKRHHRKKKEHKRSKSMPTLTASTDHDTNLKRKRNLKKDGMQKYDLCSPNKTLEFPKRRSPPLPKKRRDKAFMIRKLKEMQSSPSNEKFLTKALILKQKEDRWISSLNDGSVYRLSQMEKKMREKLRDESKTFIRNSALEREEKRKKRIHFVNQNNKSENVSCKEVKNPRNQKSSKEDPVMKKENVSQKKGLEGGGNHDNDATKKKTLDKSFNNSCETKERKTVNKPNDKSILRKMTKRIVTLEKKLAMLGIDCFEEDGEEYAEKRRHQRRPFRLINGPNIEHIGDLQIDSALMESPTNKGYQSNIQDSPDVLRYTSTCLYHSPERESVLVTNASNQSPSSIVGCGEEITTKQEVDSMSNINHPGPEYYTYPQDKAKKTSDAIETKYCSNMESLHSDSPLPTEKAPITSNLSVNIGCEDDWISPYL